MTATACGPRVARWSAVLRARLRDGRGDRGSAIVEFCYLALLLMVPLAYAMLTVFQLQKAAFAVSSASREAGRAFVTASDPGSGYGAALAAARIAASDHRLSLGADAVSIGCFPDPGCSLTPGQRVEARVDVQVPLPLVPRVLAGAVPASVAVSGRHVETVDQYRATPYVPSRR